MATTFGVAERRKVLKNIYLKAGFDQIRAENLAQQEAFDFEEFEIGGSAIQAASGDLMPANHSITAL